MSHTTILVLGAGLVTAPLVSYLSDHGFHVIVASRTLAAVEKMVHGLPNTRAVELDVEQDSSLPLLEELIQASDGVVSMLPYLLHPRAARIALAHKKHFFTTSYVTAEMRSFDEQAKQAGVIMINECGVDPGTDHMSAKRVIDHVVKNGGKIVSFTSFCGGLPAPDANDNPFGYKLSWAPRGVLLASRNTAHFLKDGKEVTIPGKDLFDNYEVGEVEGVGKLEKYPNRDSTNYIDVYGIKDTQTIVRGTYRYPGWCRTIKKIADLGYLSIEEEGLEGLTYAELLGRQVADQQGSSVKEKMATFLHIQQDDVAIQNMEWLGLLSEKKIPAGIKTKLDALCALCKERWVYKVGERDMLVMRHEFVAEYPDRREYLSSSMVDFGIPHGPTSMSRTVSLPIAIAIRLVFEGKVTLTGVQIPIIPELYNPILEELETLGIRFVEKVERVEKK